MRRPVAAIAALLTAAGVELASQAQAPVRDQPRFATTGTAVLTGVVVTDDERRTPVRSAVLRLSRTGIEDIRTAASAEDGRFVFAELPAASYTLSASKGGYIARSFGAPQSGMPGSSIVLADGQQLNLPAIPLLKGAVIAGRLLDRNGRAVVNMTVETRQFVAVGTERRPRNTTGASGRSVTNAHGEYRIFGLLPGDYLVYAAVPATVVEFRETTAPELTWAAQPSGPAPLPGRAVSAAPTLYPGTTNESSATPVRVGRGEERAGVDFHIQTVPVSRVRGIVTGADGRPRGTTIVARSSVPSSVILPFEAQVARTAPDGSFTFLGVPPGDFRLTARALDPGDLTGQGRVAAQWGTTDFTISGQEVADVAIRLQPAMSLSGRVTFAGTGSGAPADLARVRITLSADQAPGALSLLPPPASNINADGSFTLQGVTPGRFRLNVVPAGQSGWWPESALRGTTDLLDAVFEVRPNEEITDVVVTLSDRMPQISGALVDGSGRPAPEFYVFVFPSDRALWTSGSRRISSARATLTGTYTIAGLPPGEYFLCALTEIDTTLQYDATYLEQFVAASIRITLGEGEQRKQDLRVGR